MNDSYPKPEMDEKLKRIDDKIRNNHAEVMGTLNGHDQTHKQILKQTKLTNGRVKSLELWRAALSGAVAVLTILVIPVLLVFLKNYL